MSSGMSSFGSGPIGASAGYTIAQTGRSATRDSAGPSGTPIRFSDTVPVPSHNASRRQATHRDTSQPSRRGSSSGSNSMCPHSC